jgi:lipopolysaccharide transport system permease protein
MLTLITGLGVGLWLAALNVHYRDVRHIIPFLTQFWMLATPIAYQAKEIFDRLPDGLEWLFALNPMVGVIEGFRNALLGGRLHLNLLPSGEVLPSGSSGGLLWVSVLASLALLVSGFVYFRRMEKTFADVV